MSDVIAVGITLDTSLAYEELSRLAAEVEGLNFTAALKVDTVGLAEARAVVKEITTAFSDMPSLSFGGVADKAIRQAEDLSNAIVALRSQLDTPLGGRGISIKQDSEEVTRMKQEQHEIDLAIKEQRLASLQATEAEREAKRAAAQEAAQAKELASFHKHVEEMRKAAEAAVNARVESERIAADALIKEQQRAAAAAKAVQENQMWSEHKEEGGSVPADRKSLEAENRVAVEARKRLLQEQALWDEYQKENSYGQSIQEPDWSTVPKVSKETPEVDRWEAASQAIESYYALEKELQAESQARKAAQEDQMWDEHRKDGGSFLADRNSWESENKAAIEAQKRIQQEQALWDEYNKERSYGQPTQEPDWSSVSTEQPEVDRWEAASEAVERYFQIEEELLNESQARADEAARKDAERWSAKANAELNATREAAAAQEAGNTKEALYQGAFGEVNQGTIELDKMGGTLEHELNLHEAIKAAQQSRLETLTQELETAEELRDITKERLQEGTIDQGEGTSKLEQTKQQIEEITAALQELNAEKERVANWTNDLSVEGSSSELAQEAAQQEKNLDLINRKAAAEDIKNQKMNYENELIEDEEKGQERVLEHMRVKTRIAQRIKDLQEQVNKELGVENRQRQASLGYAKNSFSETFRGLALIGVGMRGANPLTMAYSVEGIIRFTQGLGKATGMAGGLNNALSPISKFVWPVAGLGAMVAGFMSLSLLAPKIATSIYSITKPYAELEDLQASFVSTFETIGPAAEKSARAFSDHFKVHIAEVYKSYTQLSMALQEKGFSEQMSLNIVGPLEERMADMGAFFVGTTEDMQKAVNSALNRQYRPLRTQTGILLNQRMVNREADRLRDQGALGSREQIEAWATIKLIMEQSAKTAGQFDREMAAGSLKLKQQAVDTAWKDTIETFGQVLAPITKTLQDFSIVSAKEWQKWLQENATMLESLAPALRDLLTASMKFSQWVLEKTGAVVGTPYEISKAVKERQELTGESKWESIKALMSATYDELPEIYKKALPIAGPAVLTHAIPLLTSDSGTDLGPITQKEKELSAARAKAVQEAEDLKKAEAELEAQRRRDRAGKWEGYTNEKVSDEEYQENIRAINELVTKSAEDYRKQVARGTAAWTVSSMETKELVARHRKILEQAQYIKDTDSAIADAVKDQLAAKELYVEATKKALKLDKQLQEIYKEVPNLTLDMARFQFEQGDIAPEDLKGKLRKGIDSALEAYMQNGESMYLDIAKQYNSFLKEIQNSTEKFGNQVSISRYSEVEAFRMSSRVWLSQGTTKIEDHTGRILKANHDMLKNQEKSLKNEADELEELRRLNNNNNYNVPGSATGLFVVAGG